MKKLFHVFALAICVLPMVAAQSACAQAAVSFEKGPLTVQSGDQSHAFEVEIADSPEETSQGLMFRESMAENAGMLFDFGEPREPQMWMRNTLIPLDMLFLNEEGLIIAIAAGARPHSERRISPGVAVKGVLEINGGVSQKLGIAPGDTVRHAIFGNVSVEADGAVAANP